MPLNYKHILVLVLACISCAPPGISTRTVKQPFKTSSSQFQNQAKAMEKGIPEACAFSPRDPQTTCLSCNLKVKAIRCVRTPFKQSQCKHNQEKLKCIIGRQAIAINLLSPKEYTCKKEIFILADTIDELAQTKLKEERGFLSLASILTVLRDSAAQICLLDSKEDIEALNEKLNSDMQTTSKIKTILRRMRDQRLQGKLNTRTARKLILALLSQDEDLKLLHDIVEDMSLSGLELGI